MSTSRVRIGLRGDGQLSQPQSRHDIEGARQAIEAVRRSFVAAMKRGDVPDLVACYGEEAIVVPQNSDVCQGRTSVERLFNSWLSSTTVREFEVQTKDLRVVGDSAYEVGTYRMVCEEAGSGPVSDQGKFLIVYERDDDGKWLITRDMSSSDRR